MKYPKHLSAQGYYNELVEQYEKKYFNFFSRKVIENTISYIVPYITRVLDQPNKELFIKTIKYLSSLERMTKEEYLEIIKEITPKNVINLLFGAAKKFINIAKLVAFQADMSINDQNRDQYLEFLQEVTIQSTKELALVNTPKLVPSSKKFIFNQDIASAIIVRDFEVDEDISKHRDLDDKEKEQWLGRERKDFNIYYNRERKKDLQFFKQGNHINKENIDLKSKKPKLD